jgi:hypothetical protein
LRVVVPYSKDGRHVVAADGNGIVATYGDSFHPDLEKCSNAIWVPP